MSSFVDLDEVVHDLMKDHPVPGAGIGVLHDGKVQTAYAGITNIDNPLPVNDRTLFQLGSISKTYTATLVMQLVTRGQISLDDPVRTYVPELRLVDQSVADTVTVKHLLNHTSGWDGTLTSGGKTPDAPLEHFVHNTLPHLEQVTPLGRRPEYNNAGVALAGRLIEKLTGTSFEQAAREFLFAPLDLHDTYFSTDDLMIERVTAGHTQVDDLYQIARPWRWPRSGNPEGGIVSTLSDQLRWARFHMSNGDSSKGLPLVGVGELKAMQTPTANLIGNVMGDAIGLGWFVRYVSDQTTYGHQGTTNGQFAELRIVPDHNFAVIVCANGDPAGTQFTRQAVTTLLDRHLGLRAAERTERSFNPGKDGDVVGTYQNNLSQLAVSLVNNEVVMKFSLQPEAAAEMGNPVFPPCSMQFLSGEHTEYVVCDGPFAGTTGSFQHDEARQVTEIDFGGRWHRRVV